MKSIITAFRPAAFALTMIALAAGCTDQTEGTDPASTGLIPLQMTASIEGAVNADGNPLGRSATRAATAIIENAPLEKFVSGDVIQLTYTNDHSIAVAAKGSLTSKATYSGSAWTISPNTYVDYPYPRSIVATYPDSTQLASNQFDSWGVKIEPATVENEEPVTVEKVDSTLKCLDFLKGEATPVIQKGGKTAAASFSMRHLHALLNVNVITSTKEPGDGGMGEKTEQEPPQVSDITLKVNFIPKEGTPIMYNIKVASGKIGEPVAGDGNVYYHAIVPTCSAREGSFFLSGALVTIDKVVYSVKFNGEKGKSLLGNYVYALTLNIYGEVLYYEFKDGISEWKPGEVIPEKKGL